MNINLIRDRKTGKSKGFCFLCYQDQRSTVLAVDNFNGITVSWDFYNSKANYCVINTFDILVSNLQIESYKHLS